MKQVCSTLAILAALAAFCASSAEVHVLCDFEKESVVKWGKLRKPKGKTSLPEDKIYGFRGGGCYGCNFVATQGPVTSGKWARSAKFSGRKDAEYVPGIRDGHHMPNRKLFTTSYVLKKLGPTDWSTFDVLEMNVWKDKPGAVELDVALEDRIVSPPIMRKFKLTKDGAWHTLKIPVKPLGEVLDLKQMVNFWIIVGHCPDGVEVRLDDIRLVKGKMESKLPVLEDVSPLKDKYAALAERLKNITASEAKHNVSKLAGAAKTALKDPSVDPRSFTKPKSIEKFGLLDKPKGYTRRVYPFGLEMFDDKSAIVSKPPSGLVYTIDAGKTWKTMSGGFKGVNSWRCEVSGDRGDLLFVGLGQCSGGGSPTSFYFRRVVHTAEGWKLGPAYPVDRDTRHCQDHYDLVMLSSGRIWVAWNHCQRFGGYGLHAKYSDDDGKTWMVSGATAALPGSVGKCNLKSDPKLFPFSDGVGCLWPAGDRTVYFSVHDGKSWAEAVKLDARTIRSAASPDGKTIFALVGGGRDGPYRILKSDGKKWEESLKPEGGGIITTQRKKARVVYAYTATKDGKNQVFLTSCGSDGKWAAPKAVFAPPEGQPQDMPFSISVPRWSPDAFVPVSIIGLEAAKGWKKLQWLQVIRVPVE